MRTISTLERDNEKMTKQLDKLTVEVMELRRTGTPRPSTEPLFELLGTTREEALGENKSTEAHWDYLLSHAVKMKERVKDLEEMAPNDDPYFVGLGQGEDVSTATAGRLLAVAALTADRCCEQVAPYLRVPKSTRIRNRRMAKRDVEHFVSTMFKRKAGDDKLRQEKDQEPLSFQEFFHQELVAKQIHQARVAEVAYNILDACKRYSCAWPRGLSLPCALS